MSAKQGEDRMKCPFRVCTTLERPVPEPSRQKILSDEKQIHLVCPFCVEKIKRKMGKEVN